MIPVKVLALLCSIAAPDKCDWHVVTTSDFSGVSMRACVVGQPQLAAFMAERPQYFLARWRCEPLDAPKKERT